MIIWPGSTGVDMQYSLHPPQNCERKVYLGYGHKASMLIRIGFVPKALKQKLLLRTIPLHLTNLRKDMARLRATLYILLYTVVKIEVTVTQCYIRSG